MGNNFGTGMGIAAFTVMEQQFSSSLNLTPQAIAVKRESAGLLSIAKLPLAADFARPSCVILALGILM
jgi:hypothetical protein